MRRLGRTLVRPGVYLTALLLLLAIVVWLAGPYLGYGDVRPLAPASVRLAILLLLALLWGIVGYLTRVRRTSEEQALLAGLRREQEEKEAAADRESAGIEERFRNFRVAARAARKFMSSSTRLPGRGRATPLYVVIGSQSAGKSSLAKAWRATAADDTTDGDAADVAQFHVSEEAVFIELDGGFISQEENWARQLWPRVLRFLRSERPRQPLNGIVLALGSDELLASTPEDLAERAAAVRRRVDEIGERLRTRTPVYVVVTKLDLLFGFEEFFENMSSEEREATLGFPIFSLDEQGSAQPLERLSEGFADLLQRMASQTTMRLYEEPDELRRRRLQELPVQFALLHPRLLPFVQALCSTNRFVKPPLVRGVFFASANQTTDFMDPAVAPLARDFGYATGGLEAARAAFPPRSRTFFAHGLLHQVLLPEYGIAGLTRPARMLLQAQGLGANIVLTLVAILLVVAWWLASAEGRAYLTRLDSGVEQARASIAAAAPDGAAPTDFAPVLTALDDLRALTKETPQRITLGLYSTGDVDDASRHVYDLALNQMALPFVWRYLRDGMRDLATPAALRLEQLKFYLMLGGERPVDQATASIVAPDFARRWLVEGRNEDVEASTTAHLAEFARVGLAALPIDLRLVDDARGLISDYTLARVAYDVALAKPAVTELPVWRPVDHMGLAGPQALSRVSGKSFWDGVPGIFTSQGLSGTMLPVSGEAAARVAQDLWAMGTSDKAADREREERRIRDGVLDLYRVDYIARWEGLLSDLDLTQADNVGDLARAMALVVSQPSPVKELAAAIAVETDPAAGTRSLLDGVPAGVPGATRVQRVQQAQDAVFGARRVVDVAGSVSEHFRAYREAVVAQQPDQQVQIDALLAAMEPLYRQMNHVASGGDVLELGTEPQALLASLTESVSALPPNLQPFFRRVLNKAAAVTGGSSRDRLAQIWRTTVLPLCRATTSGRYPFDPRSRNDASLADFTSLLGPKGAIASFRNDRLRPFIDTSAKPWRWRTGQQFGLGLDDAVLRTFEKADEITTAYFGESETPQVAFIVEPVSLDIKARAFQLDIGGPTLVYSHGPPVAAPFTWPPQNPAAEAILSMTPELDGERNMLRFQGPWSLFRLFDAGLITVPDATDVVPYQFKIGSRSLRLQVTAPPTRNPFARDILSEFSCPVLD